MSSDGRGPEGVRETTGDLRAALAEVQARGDQEKARADRLAAELAYLLDRMPQTADGTAVTSPQVPVVRRGAGGGHRTPKERRWLRAVPAVLLAALWPLRRALRHSTAAKAVAAHKIAATLTVAAVGVGVPVAAVVTVHTLTPSSSQPWDGSAPAPAASVVAAIPVTSPGLIVRLTRPRAGTTDAKRARLAEGGILPVLPSVSSQSSPSSQPATQPSQAPSSAAAGGPAVLSGIPSALDLSSGTPTTITLGATGDGGWVSWQIGTAGAGDLDFSQDHGILRPGQSVTVTVSVDPAQAVDGDPSETFTIGGQSVTAQLPAPVAAPSPAVTGSDVPTDFPSLVAPSPSSS